MPSQVIITGKNTALQCVEWGQAVIYPWRLSNMKEAGMKETDIWKEQWERYDEYQKGRGRYKESIHITRLAS